MAFDEALQHPDSFQINTMLFSLLKLRLFRKLKKLQDNSQGFCTLGFAFGEKGFGH